MINNIKERRRLLATAYCDLYKDANELLTQCEDYKSRKYRDQLVVVLKQLKRLEELGVNITND